MKKLVFLMLVLTAGAVLFAQAQGPLPEYHFAAGNWNLTTDRLYQNDARSGLAKVNIRIPQSGPMIYEFNARYEMGAEDGHGGFGFHLFTDNVIHQASWGSGSSYLLWLNYDEKPESKSIPRGLSGQVYRSRTNSTMELVASIDLNEYAYLLTYENLSQPVPFRVWANGNTGEVRIYDPTDESGQNYFYFNIDRKDLPLRGNWITLRTNGIRMSFGL